MNDEKRPGAVEIILKVLAILVIGTIVVTVLVFGTCLLLFRR